jgi:hypothetical protein
LQMETGPHPLQPLLGLLLRAHRNRLSFPPAAGNVHRRRVWIYSPPVDRPQCDTNRYADSRFRWCSDATFTGTRSTAIVAAPDSGSGAAHVPAFFWPAAGRSSWPRSAPISQPLPRCIAALPGVAAFLLPTSTPAAAAARMDNRTSPTHPPVRSAPPLRNFSLAAAFGFLSAPTVLRPKHESDICDSVSSAPPSRPATRSDEPSSRLRILCPLPPGTAFANASPPSLGLAFLACSSGYIFI